MRTNITFYESNNSNAIHFCAMRIKVKEIKKANNPDQYYDITYKYKLSSKSQRAKELHPFKDDIENKKGEIIKKNALTEQLIKYLFMDIDELAKYSGNTNPYDYKLRIIKSITLFWD